MPRIGEKLINKTKIYLVERVRFRNINVVALRKCSFKCLHNVIFEIVATAIDINPNKRHTLSTPQYSVGRMHCRQYIS